GRLRRGGRRRRDRRRRGGRDRLGRRRGDGRLRPGRGRAAGGRAFDGFRFRRRSRLVLGLGDGDRVGLLLFVRREHLRRQAVRRDHFAVLVLERAGPELAGGERDLLRLLDAGARVEQHDDVLAGGHG